jgi:DHA1 family inner membrane transport protein
MPLALIALTIASLGIGTTEFVIMGLLPDVANDLGVTIPVRCAEFSLHLP